MSRAALYKKSEELKQRYSLYGLFATVFYLVAVLVGGAVYASTNLPVYLSLNAAYASGYGTSVFVQSLLVLLSFILLATGALLVFLSRATTARGEFTSSTKLIRSSIVVTALAIVFSASALFPPASHIINEFFYLYLVLIIIALGLAAYSTLLLKAVVNYYTPRRK
ncbi:MAG: hypothetical protein ABWK05_07485 [Pyrobaculum sp.]